MNETQGIAREAARPLRTIDGLKVYVHYIEPTVIDLESYAAWWRGVLGRRVTVKDDNRDNHRD